MGQWPKIGPVMRAADQLIVAIIGTFLLVVMLLSLSCRHFLGGGVVDIEGRLPPPVTFQLNINTATWPEFALLPGIGEVRAKRIVALRAQRGQFARHEELVDVRGIGAKTLARIRPYLTDVETENDGEGVTR